jgi:thiol-disulfide isomerase/thioredoxin
MKHFIIFFIIFIAISGCKKSSEIIISGKIEGKMPDSISYSIPVNGVSYPGFKENIKPDSIGNFKIILNSKLAAFVILTFPGRSSKTIIIEPGEKYNISINIEAKKDFFKITGPGEAGQNLYNTLPNPFMVQLEAKKFIKEPSQDTIKMKISNMKNNDISSFKKLLDKKEISRNFYDLIIIDRDCYYATLSANVQFIKYVISSSGTDPNVHFEYPIESKQLWESVYIKDPPEQSNFLRTRWWFEYVTTFLSCKEYLSASYKRQNLIDLSVKGLYNTYAIEEAKKYLSLPSLEYYIPAYFYFESLDLVFEKEYISLFEKYNVDFPESKYTKYIEPWINSIKEFYAIADLNFKDNIRFVANYDSIKFLKEAIKSLKGKKIYVDVWATWCEPCKAEFAKKDGLLRRLQSQGTEILFISIDVKNREELWKNMIKYYNLQGFHIRASNQLNADLRSIFSKEHKGSFYIPFHILIDESGKIVKTE